MPNTGSEGTDPEIIQLSNGNVLIAFASGDETAPTDSAGLDIRGQIYDPEGNKVGSEIRLNNARFADTEFQPSITALADGGFAIAYIDFDPMSGISVPTFESDVQVEVYDASGTFERSVSITNNVPIGPVFEAFVPDIASASATSALVTWINLDNGDVEARHFNPQTGATLSEFTIFSGATGANQGISTLAMTALNNGNYAVLFGDNNPGDDNLFLQIADTDSTVGSRITVSSSGDIDDVSVTTLSNGNIAIAYTVDGTGGSNNGVRYAIHTQTGTLITTNQNPATTVAGNQTDTAVAALDDGGFIVFWFDEDTHDLHGQRISANGTKVGNEFDVRNFGGTDISNISATALEDGRVQITWQEEFSDDNVTTAIFDTRDNANGTPTSAGLQIGTIGNDIFDVGAGAIDVLGAGGNDRISVDQSEVDAASVFDGGTGRDVLIIEDVEAGTWSFTGEAVRNFEEIEFEATVGDFDRTASFFASQLTSVDTFDFDAGLGSVETLRIFAGGAIVLDYSGVSVEGFSDGEDSIEYIGDSSAESISGTARSEIFDTGAGADTLNGNGGNDRFIVNDDGVTGFYNGGTGSDTLDFSGVSTGFNIDLVSFPNGSVGIGATVVSYTSIENIIGGSGGDNLRGAADVLGGDGNDLLRGSGNNTVFGEGDDDNLRILSADGSPNFDGGSGTDTFNTSFLLGTNMYVDLNGGYRLGDTTAGAFDGTLSGIENYFGDSGFDVVIGNGDDNDISGNNGNDTLDGGGGDDTLNGGFDDDTLIGGFGFDDINGGDNDDLIIVGLGHEIDHIDGGNGDDSLDGSASAFNMRVDLADGTHEYNGDGNESNFLNIENVTSGSGDDALSGDGAANRFDSGSGVDTILGQDGADTVQAGEGADIVKGGKGADELFGEKGADLLEGGKGSDLLEGGNGADTLLGGDGVDSINGGNDDDLIIVGLGHDIDDIDGGKGVDSFDGSASAFNMGVDLAGGTHEYNGDGNERSFLRIENVATGSGDDAVSGNEAANHFNSGSGADTILGQDGADTVQAGDGADIVKGGKGADALFGEKGDDSLEGGKGADVLEGGKGADRLKAEKGDDVLYGGKGNDLLTGGNGVDDFIFKSGDGNDTITDFDANLNKEDIVLTEVTEITDFADLSSNHMSQVGNNVVIDDGANLTITLLNVDLADLGGADFIF